ncbi:MAG: transferase [Micropruina sp.]
MLPPDAARRLADRLRAADYTYAGVAERIGPAGLDGLARNATVPAARALRDADDPQATLIRAFALQADVPAEALRRAFGDLDALAPIVEVSGDIARARIEIRPYAFEEDAGTRSAWLASDLTPNLDGRLAAPRADFVLGLSPASITLAQLTMRTPRGRALDLGTGCGIQSLHLAGHCDAVGHRPQSAGLRRHRTDRGAQRRPAGRPRGSLYRCRSPTRAFDLIVTNPPYVMSPPDGERLVCREGGLAADGLMRAVVAGAPSRRSPPVARCRCWATGRSPPTSPGRSGSPAGSRRPGATPWCCKRNGSTPTSTSRSGSPTPALTGTPEYARCYAEWVDYFDSLGIVAVGLGWLALYRNEAADPVLSFEEWPHQVHQPVGDAFAEFPGAARTARLADAALLASHLSCDPAVAIARPWDGREPSTPSTSCCAAAAASAGPTRSTPRWPRSSARCERRPCRSACSSERSPACSRWTPGR